MRLHAVSVTTVSFKTLLKITKVPHIPHNCLMDILSCKSDREITVNKINMIKSKRSYNYK